MVVARLVPASQRSAERVDEIKVDGHDEPDVYAVCSKCHSHPHTLLVESS